MRFGVEGIFGIKLGLLVANVSGPPFGRGTSRGGELFKGENGKWGTLRIPFGKIGEPYLEG